MTGLTNARGYTTTYTYDKVGNLICITDALNGTTSSAYDGNGNLISETDALGYTTTYTYNRLGWVLTITDAEGGVTTSEYDANGNVVKATDAEGHVITYTYDALNRLSSYVDTEGYTHGYTYDANGNVLTETDGNGNTTTYVYDGIDRIIRKTDGQGGVASSTYDADGRLIKSVDEEGAETTYLYDENNRVIQMTDALGNATTYTYDEMDRVLTVTDARGGVTRYAYTARGEVAEETDAEGYSTLYAYDENGNMVQMTTLDGATTYRYDELDRLIATTTPDKLTETLEYDALGRVTASIDKSGQRTTYVYDAEGNVVETIDALGNSATYEYDLLGNLTRTSLHRVDTQDGVDSWEVTLYEYDGRGLTTRTVDALGYVTTYEYDGNGNLKKATDADGYVTEYTYNSLDLVESINYNGGKSVSYRYNAVGELVEMNDWTGTNTYEFDLLKRITSATDQKGNVTAYTYDATGNQTSITYPDQSQVTNTYDLLGQMTSVTEASGDTTYYEYDGMGRQVVMYYPNDWTEYYIYDKMGRIIGVTELEEHRTPSASKGWGSIAFTWSWWNLFTSLSSSQTSYPKGWSDCGKYDELDEQYRAMYTWYPDIGSGTIGRVYRYDANGNMTYEYTRANSGVGRSAAKTTYTYDALNRLTKTTEGLGLITRTYQYDSLGNLTYETQGLTQKTDYKLNDLNQITTQSDNSWLLTSKEYTYDKRGNLVTETNVTNTLFSKVKTTEASYVYDETNKMVSGTNAKGEVSGYLYNGLNALVQTEWSLAENPKGYKNSLSLISKLLFPSNLKNPVVVVKDYVVDYTAETLSPLTETEVNGVSYRYVYGADEQPLSVTIYGVESSTAKCGSTLLSGTILGTGSKGNELHLYYHTDMRGTVEYMTSAMTGKIVAWADYNEWGEVNYSGALILGARQFDLVKRYATHDYDSTLGLYYAKARFYDPETRRFMAVDPILNPVEYAVSDYLLQPMQLVQYLYVLDNPINDIDLSGEFRNGDVLYRGKRFMARADVEALQGALNDYKYSLGFSELDTDGSFGPATEAAVNKYKDKYMPTGNKEANRGKVGYTTWLSLGLPIDKPLNPASGFVPSILFKWDSSQGIWYAGLDAKQRAGGYNRAYDAVFSMVDYKYFKSRFEYGSHSWLIEGWKGNYMNMGVGGEIGVYYNDSPYGSKLGCLEHYGPISDADMLYMQFTLGRGGGVIMTKAREKHWWITGFRPSIGTIPSSSLTMTGAIYFPDWTMAKEFKDGLQTVIDEKRDTAKEFDNNNFHAGYITTTKIGSTSYAKVSFTWG